MGQDGELRRLEQFVEKLLLRFSELRAEKARLLQELKGQELQVEELRRTLSAKEAERSEIGLRVNKIVEQIEEWEMGLEEAKTGDTPAEGIEEVASPSGSQTAADRKVAELRGEEDGRIQQNLFSLASPQR